MHGANMTIYGHFIEMMSAANLPYVAYDEKGTRSELNCVGSSLEDLPDRCMRSTLKMGHDHCNSRILKTMQFMNCMSLIYSYGTKRE